MKKRIYFLLWFIMMGMVCCTTVCLQASVKNQLLERCRHLDGYEYFKKYNQNHYFNHFFISETWKDGEPFYKLSSEDGIELIVNKEQTEAVVTYVGKSLSFGIYGFLSSNANVYLMDLTNDGVQELIYEESLNGTEGNIETCMIIDLREMRIIETEEFLNSLLDKISVEIVKTDKQETLCKITDSNHHIYFGHLGGVMMDEGAEATIECDCYAMELDLINEKLRAYLCFSLSGCEEGSLLGDISSFFDYSVRNQSFVLQDEYKVTLWES